MNKKTLILLILVVGLIGVGAILISTKQKNPLSNPQSNLIKKTLEKTAPSETYIEYTDPAGFSFSYPDNLSISKAEIEDPSTYTDLQLFSKDVNGSLNLKIADSNFTSLDDWLKKNQIPSSTLTKEVNLGDLKALEVKTADRLLLGSLDEGVQFSIEFPLIEEDFWMKVYNKILTEFTFVSPDRTSSQGISNYSSTDVTFEGEEIVE